jgi:5,10-methylenetetrahydromethanopterin reductase
MMEYGISFAASFDAARQAQHAEALGYSYIGFYDSPALGADVWITIANALQATHRIQVGAEVLIPHLRHPVAQASAIATVEHLAPGRLYVGIGTGFTGRMAMGQSALKWSFVSEFLKQVKALLAGDDVVIDGGVTRMLHPPGFAPPRPIRTPFLVAANGPKGIGVAREVGDGLIYGGDRTVTPGGFSILQMGGGGIVLESGESPTSPRVLEAAKPSFGLQYHLAYDGFHHGPIQVEHLPYGEDWLKSVEALPSDVRHLHVHEGHAVAVSVIDAAFIERHPDALAAFAAAASCTPAQLRERTDAVAALGATRLTCQITFADWERDMARTAKALGLTSIRVVG